MRLSQPHPQRISPKASKDDAQAPKDVLRALSRSRKSCSCRSPRLSAALRGSKRSCSCRSSRSFAALRGKKKLPLQLPFSVALRVLCGQKVLQLQFFAVLRGPSWKKKLPLQLPFSVALRVLCGQKVLQLQFFAALRGSKGSCSCRSPWPSVSSVDKRCCRCSFSRPFVDQKEVAVAVLRGPPCPPWTKGVAVAVFRGPSWIKMKLQLQFFAVLRGPSWKKEVAVAVAVLRHPPRTKQNKRQHTQRLQKACPKFPAVAVLFTITTNVYPY